MAFLRQIADGSPAQGPAMTVVWRRRATAGFLAMALSDLSIPFRRHLAFVSGACVLGALVLVSGALVLERVCRLPDPPEDEAGAP